MGLSAERNTQAQPGCPVPVRIVGRGKDAEPRRGR